MGRFLSYNMVDKGMYREVKKVKNELTSFMDYPQNKNDCITNKKQQIVLFCKFLHAYLVYFGTWNIRLRMQILHFMLTTSQLGNKSLLVVKTKISHHCTYINQTSIVFHAFLYEHFKSLIKWKLKKIIFRGCFSRGAQMHFTLKFQGVVFCTPNSSQ